MTVQCCKCKKVFERGRWREADAPLVGPVSHSYCPDCLLETHIELFNERASNQPHKTALVLSGLLAEIPAAV